MSTSKMRAVIASGLVLVGLGWASAQEPKDQDPKDIESKVAEPTTFRRVPPYFGQIGLTPDQRERVYEIRGVYQATIADLKRQIEESQAAELAECEDVLTDAQRKLLENRRASSRRPTGPRSGGATPKAGSDETPDDRS